MHPLDSALPQPNDPHSIFEADKVNPRNSILIETSAASSIDEGEKRVLSWIIIIQRFISPRGDACNIRQLSSHDILFDKMNSATTLLFFLGWERRWTKRMEERAQPASARLAFNFTLRCTKRERACDEKKIAERRSMEFWRLIRTQCHLDITVWYFWYLITYFLFTPCISLFQCIGWICWISYFLVYRWQT